MTYYTRVNAETGETEQVDLTPEEIAARTPTLEDLKAGKREDVAVKLNTLLTGGYTVESGTLAGEVLQTRNIEDRTDWLVSQATYSALVAAGSGAVEGAQFRTADNQTFTVTFSEGLSILLTMAAWGAACMNRSWVLKDEIASAQDQTALDAVDIASGWPS